MSSKHYEFVASCTARLFSLAMQFTHWSIRLALETTARYTYCKNTKITIDQGCIQCMFIIYDTCYRAMMGSMHIVNC